ncbi:MAG: oligosaccharyl transferase, archaeosortase A system-associated [Dehalococcoidia bacterium]|nr:oligosaccharyl transferase, archaeosortase A system-associated [Dehalococcoidia bacterium]MDD5494354.1 oligosaccharyl transferase, archaeosortase A system-associated [Dehalococcoidia bacterium]
MTQRRIEITVYILLALICVISFILRVAVPWSQVFVDQWVKFTDNDAYYYMRLLDNISHHFPSLGSTDPYFHFPGEYNPLSLPQFFVYLMGFFAWLFGAGSPSQHTVDLIGVFFPAVIGALMAIPVFFIAREVFNKWAGLIAAAVISVLPGEYLVRTLLGNPDSHGIEIFFSTLFMLFLILAVKRGGALSLQAKSRRELIKPLIFSILAGLCLGFYMWSWQGALLFVLIGFIWLAIQFVSDHIRGKDTFYLGFTGTITYLTALLLALVSGSGGLAILSLLIAALIPVALAALSWLMNRFNQNVYIYPVLVAGLAIATLSVLYTVSPALTNKIFSTIGGIFTWMTGSFTAEMQPMLIEGGSFTLGLLWGNYTLCSILALVALGIVIYQAARKGTPEKMLLAVWTLFILVATLAMRRFAYYLAVDIAVLSAYSCWLLLEFTVLKENKAGQGNKPAKKARARVKKASREPGTRPVMVALGIVVVGVLTIYPNTGPLPGGDKPFFDVASKALFTPSDAWCQAMDWMRDQTTEPFGDPDYYYAQYKQPAAGATYEYPSTDYSVICWWDYGYWISRLGHRTPFSNPGSSSRGEQYYLSAQDQYAAARYANTWGARYVIVDEAMINWRGVFPSMAAAAQQPATRYFDLFYIEREGQLRPVLLYFPEFYKTMAVRLFCFDGKEYLPQERTVVIEWEMKTTDDGTAYKEITDQRTFDFAEQAEAFIRKQESGNWHIVGKYPNASPVWLEEIGDYKLVYSSSQKTKVGNVEIPSVKIFEYKRNVIPVTGDWNGDKKWEIGLWIPSSGYFLLDMNGNGLWEPDKGDLKLGPFGYHFDIPLTGDWNGDGRSEVGTWRPADRCFYLDINGDGNWNGEKGDLKLGPLLEWYNVPLGGDWTGEGRDKPGLWRVVANNGFYFYLAKSLEGAWNTPDGIIRFGPVQDVFRLPVSGDWNGDNKDTPGLWDASTRFFTLFASLDNTSDTSGDGLIKGPFGNSFDSPVAGDWSGNGRSNIGTWNPKDLCFYLDIDGDGAWNQSKGDVKLGPFKE